MASRQQGIFHDYCEVTLYSDFTNDQLRMFQNFLGKPQIGKNYKEPPRIMTFYNES